MAIDWSEDIVICDLADEPDLSEELSALHAKLAEQPRDSVPDVILDMSSVTYLNSSNIAQILRVRKVLVESQSHLRLCAVADPVWSVMLLTGLDKVFSFAPDKATAIASLQLEAGGDQ